ncbi:IS66 family insertion sequence element accessory protein TnpB [Butyrivibrio sp. M55]|jgi:transposase|uniref:IS66 family insertion sequence element accessory protein TnpB n=1 Tax=Butyrivibrio sp. M55 TaxID=1855323 RepID=UPI0008F03BC3|nr:IS66 family insertion sequence element accessory protein TnpB [Butyrivibrio sp. M55]SFU96447.1 transposase [Butyrivibrio sp. M55]
MLAELGGVKKIYLAVGYTDLRLGINGLAQTVGTKFDLNPFEKGTLFLFCGRRCDRIKALLWEGDGFLLLYKRLEDGRFDWPRSKDQAANITTDQYRMLLMGLNPIEPRIKEVVPSRVS